MWWCFRLLFACFSVARKANMTIELSREDRTSVPFRQSVSDKTCDFHIIRGEDRWMAVAYSP